ncbi:uncharacterized protein LOC129582976 [Paramacrobiotus metropolitanus]|uniref:uncharacterized protein LOC129582976 n=1 Tax=Paramacrobiotus metropolitanus TaxID=2943436 RepID=UPI00244584B0|nr:uncharacterized protein LOC129582976 [Paramacrobiotus metropolitanus]XP_055330594.1 uncharacterized protein LOC129582976 [Paramacrobiotus metropolitanus]
MPFYGNEEGDVTRWNAVEVRSDDGILQHGDVINVAEGGLIIDFHCAHQRAQFVEYKRTFHSRSSPRYSESERNLEVLQRRYPDGAWIWKTGRIPTVGQFVCEDAQLMELQLTGGTVKQLVPTSQIREPPSQTDLKERRVRKNDFVVRCCRLPGGYWGDSSQLLKHIFENRLSRRYSVVCTSLLSQTVLYLQDRNAVPLTSDQAKETYCWAKKDVEAGPSVDMGTRALHRQWNSAAQKPRKVSVGMETSLPLPDKLLVETFGSLDSIGRIRCRRVCSLWDSILSAEVNFPDVRVSGGHPDFGVLTDAYQGIYWAASCLVKCLSSRTKVIVITDVSSDRCSDLATLINTLLTPATIPMLVFYGCDWCSDDATVEYVVGGVVETLRECRACETVVWKNCDMIARVLTAHVAQHSFRARSGDELEREL